MEKSFLVFGKNKTCGLHTVESILLTISFSKEFNEKELIYLK